MPFSAVVFGSGEVDFSFFFVLSLFQTKANNRHHKTKKKKKLRREFISLVPLFALFLSLFSSSNMDDTAPAPGPSGGSAPRLRVDELLDDVANSVRREEQRGRIRALIFLRGWFFSIQRRNASFLRRPFSASSLSFSPIFVALSTEELCLSVIERKEREKTVPKASNRDEPERER